MSGAAAPPASGASFSVRPFSAFLLTPYSLPLQASQSGVGASGVATSTASPADVSAAAIQANSAPPAGSGAATSLRLSGRLVLSSLLLPFGLLRWTL